MTTDIINEKIKDLLNTITNSGYTAYIVGGAVRDRLSSKPINDYDICTTMSLEMVKELFPPFHIMKQTQNRNAGVLNIEGTQVEISIIKGNSLLEDLSQRDFTINTLLEDANGKIYDHFGALSDIKNKVIRLVREDGFTFDEDAFRILRGLRLAAKLGYQIDENCYHHMLRTYHNLKFSAPEKVYTELKKMLEGEYFSSIFNKSIPFLLAIIPELANTNFAIVNKLLSISPNQYLIRLFIIMNELNEEEIKKIAQRLKMDKKTLRYLLVFIKNKEETPSEKNEQVKAFINNYPIEYIDALFTYQEIILKTVTPNREKLKHLLAIEKIYYDTLQQQLENQIKNLKVNPQLFSKYSRGKKLVQLESEVVSKIIQRKLLPKPEEISKYLALKLESN